LKIFNRTRNSFVIRDREENRVFGFLEFGGKPHFEVLKGKKHLIIC
jgi:hypothetical protein